MKLGNFDVMVNCLVSDGTVVPLPRSGASGRSGRVVTHLTPAGSNEITVDSVSESDSDGFLVSWRPAGSPDAVPCPVGTVCGFRDIVPVGNMVAIASASGLSCLVWHGSGYSMLSVPPPSPVLGFGLRKTGEIESRVRLTVDRCCVPDLRDDGSFSLSAVRDGSSAESLRRLRSLLSDNISEASLSAGQSGFVWQPFLVRYAFRLFDGSYAFPSPPLLMMPCAGSPLIRLSEVADSPEEGKKTVLSSLSLPYFALDCGVVLSGSGRTALEAWRPLIAAVDIFASPPLPVSDPDSPLPYPPFLSVSEFRRRCSLSFAFPSSSVTGGQENLSGLIFAGRYAEDAESPCTDHFIDLSAVGSDICWNIPAAAGFASAVMNPGPFCRIASVPVGDIVDSAGSGASGESSCSGPVFVVPVLRSPDVVLSDAPDGLFRDIAPQCLYSFGGRLVAGAPEVRLSPPDSPAAFSLGLYGAGSSSSSAAGTVSYTFRVYSGSFGVVRTSAVTFAALPSETDASLPASLPLLLFYPDPGATHMEISSPGNPVRTFQLTPCPGLGGACVLCPPGASPPASVEAPPGESFPPGVLTLASSLIVSAPGNPLVISAEGSMTVGTGKILRLVGTGCGLSGGLSGRYPLYLFTSAGIYAVDMSADGRFGLCERLADSMLPAPPPYPDILSRLRLPLYSSILTPGYDEAPGMLTLSGPGQFRYLYVPPLKQWIVDDPGSGCMTVVSPCLVLSSRSSVSRQPRRRPLPLAVTVPGFDASTSQAFLYGSDDGENWCPLAAVSGTVLPPPPGPPRRFYRIVLRRPLPVRN